MIGVPGKPHEFNDFVGAGVSFFLLGAVDFKRVGNIVNNRPVREQTKVLEDHGKFGSPQFAQTTL